MGKYIVGMTGASGSIYGKRLIEELSKEHEVFFVSTDYGREVFEYEIGISMDQWTNHLQESDRKISVYDIGDMFSPIASGSFNVDGMVIIPCSMGTISKVCHGMSDNLLNRAADVMIKEKRQLIIVPRETPLSTIHLKNMLRLSELGVMIVPPMSAYYHLPKTIDELVELTVGRLITHLGIKNDLHQQWMGDK